MSKQTKANIKAVLILITLVTSIFTMGYAVGADNTRKAEYEEHKQMITYTVKPGDTLWSIAEKYKPSWVDTREYIYEIQDLNGMSNSNIDIGDKLSLYTDEDDVIINIQED